MISVEIVYNLRYLDVSVGVHKKSGRKFLWNSTLDAYSDDQKNSVRTKVLLWLDKNCSKYGTRILKLEGHSEELRYTVDLPSKQKIDDESIM
jgi:hypothetical protein